MEYGFVYIWRDRKHKRYYIGCHWGAEDDGYICSSTWMKQSYNRRPNDFKRKIICKVYTNRNDLFDEEAYWQSFIKDHELKNRYFNIKRHGDKHWSTDPIKYKTISKKISSTLKWKNENDDEYKEKMKLAGLKKRGKKHTKETKEKRRKSMLKTMEEKYPLGNRLVRSVAGSNEHRLKLSESSKKMWENRTTEEKNIIGEKISKVNQGIQHRLGKKNTPDHNRKISEAQKGKTLSNEHKENLKKAAKNRKGWSEEAKIRHSQRIKEMWAKRKI